MLKEKQIAKIFDFPNYRDVFPLAQIAGGVSFFMWKSEKQPTYEFVSCANLHQTHVVRKWDNREILIRDLLAPDIIDRLDALKINGNKKLSSRVSPRKPFGIEGNYKPKEQGVPCWFKQKEGLKFVSTEDYTDEGGYKDKWKVLIPRAPIAGQTDFTKPIRIYSSKNVKIAQPGEVCSETYIVAGAFNSNEEAISFLSYLFTKIVRFLLLQCIISQDVTRECFMFVPDLGTYNKVYTDEILCNEWKITDKEWTHIDSKILETE